MANLRQRLRPERGRAGPARRGRSDYLVGLKPDLRGFTTDTITNMSSRQRLDPARLERRRHQHPLPGRRPGHDPVPEEQGGDPGRQRLLRDPGQRRAPGHGAAVHRLHPGPENAAKNVGLDRLPDADEGADEAVRGAGQGRAGDRRSRSRTSTNGQQFANLERRGPGSLGPDLDRGQGRLIGAPP